MHNHFKFLKRLNVDQDVSKRLSILLNNVVEGSNDVYRSPLAKDLSTDELLSHFEKSLGDKIAKLHPVLLDQEKSNLSKFGPRSIAKPWSQRKDMVLQYFERPNRAINYSDLRSFAKPTDKLNLRPLSLDKASDFLKNNTNSGLPFYRPKGQVKAKVLDNFDKLLERKDPCILFTRTQEGGKTRTVWGFPIADTLNEMRFYRPLLEYQRKLSWRSALVGPNQVNKRMTHIINSAKAMGQNLVSIDFSAFDASVKTELQALSFDYIKSLYQSKFGPEIDYVKERFANIGILTPDGVISGSHGVPSGSTFTNEVDSISQYIIAMHSQLAKEGLYEIQGDDGAYAIDANRVDDFIENFIKYGLNVNKEKSFISSDYVVYLQNLYHSDLRHDGIICGIYPITRAFNRIIFQERWDDFEDYGMSGQDYYSLRSISILENCKYHPLFEDFVKFIIKLDKYNLQVSQKGITQYVEMMSNKLGTEGLFTNQYGDDLKGLRGFKTFQVIKKVVG